MSVKSSILEILEQHRGENISGEALAGELGCTRAAIHKAIRTLRDEGYQIDAGQNRGYQLLISNSRLSAEGIRPYLDKQDLFIKVFRTTASTNQEAKKAIVAEEVSHGSIFISEEQTQGKGRRGRHFDSPADSGLYLSIVLRPQRDIQNGLLISAQAAVSVYLAVRKVCGVCLDIRWVNDLYYHQQKVCGIMTEAITDFESGNLEYVVVGIGIHLYESKTVDLAITKEGTIYTSKEDASCINKNLLAAQIVNALLKECENSVIDPIYIERNIILGQEISVLENGIRKRFIAKGILPDGRLKVVDSNQKEKILTHE